MPDRFTLLTFSFCFILHNVCSWSVSEPLNHTFNDDDSVSVTCVFNGEEKFQLEAKLKMNNEIVCEVYNKSQVQDKHKHDCTWEHKDNKFTFTLMKPEGLLKNTFYCEMSKIKPFPVQTKKGPEIKLFRGCNKSLAPPKNSCPFTNQTNNQDRTPVESRTPEEMYTLLICGLIIVVVMLSIYSIILTAVYIRLKTERLCYIVTQDVNEFVSSSEQIWRNLALYHMLTNGSSAVNGQLHKTLFDGLDYLWVIVTFLSAVWTLILTAPIHCRGLVTKPESSDTLTYVPMQRNVNRRDLDNTEYVDMREVQKRGGSNRDMNHNSHLAVA